MNRTRWMLVLAGIWLTVWATGCGDEPGPELNLEEFAVNTSPDGGPDGPAGEYAVGMAAGGQFLVAFGTRDSSGSGNSTLRGQFFDSNATKLGNEILLNPNGGDTVQPFAAFAPDGSSFVVWLGGGGVNGRRYDTNGAPLGAPFSIHPRGYAPSLSIGAGGQIVVVYQTVYQNGFDDVFAQRFSPDGTRLGAEIPVIVDRGVQAQRFPKVFVGPDGGFVVSWAASPRGLHLQRFAADGSKLGSEIEVPNADDQGGRLAGRTNGDFVVGWNEPAAGGFLRRYSSTGTLMGGTIQVPGIDSLAMRPDGSVVTVRFTQLSGKFQVVAQRIAADGSKMGGELVVSNPPATEDVYVPVVAAGLDSRFIVIWEQCNFNDFPTVCSGVRGRLFEN